MFELENNFYKDLYYTQQVESKEKDIQFFKYKFFHTSP
jgi:hypothetical protein